MKLRVDRLSLLNIAADRVEIGVFFIFIKHVIIINIQDLWKFVVAEISIHKISCPDQIFGAHKALVRTVFFIIPDASSLLSRKETASMDRSRRNADHPVKGKALIQKYVQNSRRVYAAHTAPFQHKSCFVLISSHLLIHLKVPPFLLTVTCLCWIFPRKDASSTYFTMKATFRQGSRFYLITL